MSADNGIYIGVFPVSEGSTCNVEYRVIHAQAIDNLNYIPEHSKNLQDKYGRENPREVYEYFKDAIPMSKEKAQTKAFDLERECGYLEYGVSHLWFNHPFSYYQEHAPEITYKWDKEDKENDEKSTRPVVQS